MAMPASTLRLTSQRPIYFDSFRYHSLFTSCHRLLPVLTCLVEPLSMMHKRNELLVFGSTCYPRKFKIRRGDKQCRCCGHKHCELCMEESKFFASTLWCRVEELFKSHFSNKCWKISEDKIGKMFVEQHFLSLMGRRAFFSLALLYIGSLLSVYAPSALAVAKREQKMGLYDEKRLLEQNKRIQNLNGAPPDFPNFVREGFDVKVVTSDNYVRCDSGLIYWDMKEGEGDYPKPGQQVVFHYTGYNESGRRIDSSYQQGSPAKTRIGINGLVPGVEEGIRTMKPGGKRRIIVPPELGPPSRNWTRTQLVLVILAKMAMGSTRKPEIVLLVIAIVVGWSLLCTTAIRTGEIFDVVNGEADVEKLAKFAVTEYNKQANAGISLKKVVSWAERTAANNVIDYYITLEAGGNGAAKQYLAVVGIAVNPNNGAAGHPELVSFDTADYSA